MNMLFSETVFGLRPLITVGSVYFTQCFSYNRNVDHLRKQAFYSTPTHLLTLTAVFSTSASEDVGDKGLMGLREGELSTLEI